MSRINWTIGSFLTLACLLAVAYGCTRQDIEKAEQIAAAPQPAASPDKTVREPARDLAPRRERPRREFPDRMEPAAGPDDRRPGRPDSRGRGLLGSQFTDSPPSGLAQCPAHPSSLGAVETENMPGRFICPPELPADPVCGFFTLEDDPRAGRAYYQPFRNKCMICARIFNQGGAFHMRGQTYKFMGYQKGDCPAGQ